MIVVVIFAVVDFLTPSRVTKIEKCLIEIPDRYFAAYLHLEEPIYVEIR